MKNIAYEKGVKDLQFDLKNKTVTLTFDTRKTDLPTLLKAFEKLGKPATVKKEAEAKRN
jgi:copper chaperone CopZ